MLYLNAITMIGMDTPDSSTDWEDPWIDLGGEG
jgi:hypothetical protein